MYSDTKIILTWETYTEFELVGTYIVLSTYLGR